MARAISLHELKNVELQECFTLMTISIGHLKTLCMSVYHQAVAFESEWKHYNSSLSNEKTLAFQYEFSFSTNTQIRMHLRIRLRRDEIHSCHSGLLKCIIVVQSNKQHRQVIRYASVICKAWKVDVHKWGLYKSMLH